MAAADNPFYIAPPNVLQALMTGEQSYQAARKQREEDIAKEAFAQAGKVIQGGGKPGDALAILAAGNNPQAFGTFANIAHQGEQLGLSREQLAEMTRSHKESEKQAAAALAFQRQQYEQPQGFRPTPEGGLTAVPGGPQDPTRMREVQAVQQGYIQTPEGGLKPIPGGPNDPATIRERAVAQHPTITVPAGASVINPANSSVIYKGDNIMSEAATEIAARQIINGDLSALQNIGRGAQGDQKITAIKNKSAEILTNEYGHSPAEAAARVSEALTKFKAGQVGASAAARTGATREENLRIILKATDAAIPEALRTSSEVSRTGWVPINRIIQAGQVIASDPKLRAFGMANLQLAEHWARAMNPTGVMRESDRDLALGFLSTADSPSTYATVVQQLRRQIENEMKAVSGGHGGQTPGHGGQTLPPQAPVLTAPPPPPGFQIVR